MIEEVAFIAPKRLSGKTKETFAKVRRMISTSRLIIYLGGIDTGRNRVAHSFRIILVDRVFDFSSHKRIWILLKHAQASLLAKVDSRALVDRAWVPRRVFQSSTAGGFIGRYVLNFSFVVIH